jgi:two-component system NtrC family response regulator
MAKVLIIDDDRIFCRVLADEISFLGHEVHKARTLEEGRTQVASAEPDVVFLDVQLPDGNGLDLLQVIRASLQPPEVIIVTGAGDVNGAEIALRNGAWDYIQKPSSLKEMTLPLLRALDFRKAKMAPARARLLNRDGIVGESAPMKRCIQVLAECANSEASVLITGETGTGKEIVAAAIHRNSARSDREFIVVDCGAMTETLVESVLFGHEKGAFTGAERKRNGLIKAADGGILFLDEVGELSLKIQKALLRVLQERRFRAVGGEREVSSDFRLIAATNRDLRKMVQTGEFREDLFFRLQGLTIALPPLRDRLDDIPDLVNYFLHRLCGRYGLKSKGISPELIDLLKRYAWPGNVRELLQTVESMLAVAGDMSILYPEHLPADIRIKILRAALAKGAASPATGLPETFSEEYPAFREFKRRAELEYLNGLIARCRGDVQKACTISGMSRSNFYQLMKSHNVRFPA